MNALYRSTVRRLRFATLTTLAAAGFCTSVAVAAQPAEKAAERTKIIVAEVGDLDRLLVDPKDAALKKAIGALPARLNDLPAEFPDLNANGAPGTEIFAFLGRILGRHTRFAIEYDMKNQDEANRFGVGVQLSWGMKSKDEAEAVGGLISSIVAAIPEEVPVDKAAEGPWAGMNQTETPAGNIRWGTRQDGANWWYQLNFGRPSDAAKVFPPMQPVKPAIGGMVTPYLQTTMDFAPLTPLVNMVAANVGGGDPAVAEVLRSFTESGLIGAEAMKTEMIAGYNDTGSVSITTYRGAGRFAQANGWVKQGLTADEMKVIPADATAAVLLKFNLAPGLDTLRQTINDNEEVARAFGEVKNQTGVDIVEDLFAQVGGLAGAYLSDSTGGGTMGSGVIVVQLKDTARFRGALDRFAGQLNTLFADERGPRGYVALRNWEMDGGRFTSLQFPGLPIPIELTYGFAGNFVVFTFNPQAAVVACRQVQGKGDAGLMSNADIAALFPKDKAFISIAYMNAQRNLSLGYGILSMIGSAMGNVVRTPGVPNPEREFGLIVPPYNELARNVRNTAVFSYWNGEDLVTETHSDRSVLVNVGAACGAIYTFAPAIVTGVGAIAAAVEEARPRGRSMEWDDRPPPPPPARPAGRPNFRILPDVPIIWEPAEAR